MRAVLIGNPRAGQKCGLRTSRSTVSDAVGALRGAGIEPEVWLTAGPGDATQLARRALEKGVEHIIAAGGDGTIQEVAQPLVHTEATLGIMPLGSVMNLARTLGITRDLTQAARVIKAGHISRMSVGQAGQHYFLEFAGVGIDAVVGPLCAQIDSGGWSKLGLLMKAACSYQVPPLTVDIDGCAQTVRAPMIVVANTPFYGPAIRLTPEASTSDEYFDVKIFDHFSRLQLLLFGLQTLEGRKPVRSGVRTLRGRTITISAARTVPAHADLARIGETPQTFHLLPAALRVLSNRVTALAPPARQPPRSSLARTMGIGRRSRPTGPRCWCKRSHDRAS